MNVRSALTEIHMHVKSISDACEIFTMYVNVIKCM